MKEPTTYTRSSSASASRASRLTSNGSFGATAVAPAEAPEASRTPLALYALTTFVSAFLLFQIEPLIAKIVLPWFGGSAGVWTVCLLFFQMALLGGYFYAHLSIRYLKPRGQVLGHAVLLVASLLLLPVIPDASWKPLGTEDPVWRILGLLGATLGLPYFLLSSTSPLLQAWYARTHESGMPYRLFALSNLGSMLALVSYPLLVEPKFSTVHQAWGWSIGFVAFVWLCGWVAMGARGEGVREKQRDDAGDDSRPGWKLQLMWLALAACASTMLLAVTNHLTQNVASIPFLWILPLALYLLSFILCFEGRGWYRRGMFMRLAAVALGGMTYAMSDDFQNLGLAALIPLFTGGLFVCSMVCHGELARLKPAPRHLTSFYLMVSLGGAVGGVLVGLVAPHLFSGYFELPIAIGWCAVMMVLVLMPAARVEDTEARELFAVIGRDGGWGFQRILWIGSIVAAVALIGCLGYEVYQFRHGSRLLVRNFYGALRVDDEGDGVTEAEIRKLTHGTINHGEQFMDEARHMQPTTYYGYHSGVGLALEEIDQRPAVRVGVIGLGTGTLAAYGRGGDVFRFYEINPLVIRVARTEFSFLRDSKARIETALGDARLSLEREPPQEYDLLAVDAFSSDAIPVHLLTREAFALYFRHLKPDGVLAVHVSNKHLNLQPIVQMAADAMAKRATVIDTNDEDDAAVFGATWVLVTGRKNFFEHAFIRHAGTPVARKAGLRMWTDDYSNLFQILK